MKLPNNVLYTFILLISVHLFAGQEQNLNALTTKKPLEVSVNLRINKIYNINSVNETYQIDGYFMYSWKNENALSFLKDSTANSIVF